MLKGSHTYLMPKLTNVTQALYPDAPIIDFGLDLLPKYLGIKCILQITSIHLLFCLNFFFVGGKKRYKYSLLKIMVPEKVFS